MDRKKRMVVERRLVEQQGVVPWWQLVQDGCTPSEIEWLASGWRAVHRGVYVTGHAKLTPWQRWYAATITTPDSALARWSWAAALDLRTPTPTEPAHVVRPGSSGKRRFSSGAQAKDGRANDRRANDRRANDRSANDGRANDSSANDGRATKGPADRPRVSPNRIGRDDVSDGGQLDQPGAASSPAHRSSSRLDGLAVSYSRTLAAEIVERDGIRMTTAARGVLDLCVLMGASQRDRLFRDAIRKKVVTRDDLHALTRTHRGQRGVGRVKELLSRYAEIPIERTRSDAEIEGLVVLKTAGEPMPLVNVSVAGYEADFVDHERRVIVELDGPQYHQFPERDRMKEEAWEAAGYSVLRRPTDDAYDDPASIIAASRGLSRQ